MSQASIRKNTVYSTIKTVSSIAFPLITFPYVNRVLQPANVGKVNFGLSVVSYFSLIASLGITTYAIRECSAVRDDKEKLSNTASQLFSINMVTTVIAYICLAFTLVFYHKLDSYRTLIIIQSLVILATSFGTEWLNSALEDFRYITIRTVSFQILSLILTFVFVRQEDDYFKYAVICLISGAGANIVNIRYRRKFCRVRFIFNLKNKIDWKRHMVPIMYMFVMILSQTIFNSVDATMLGIMKGEYEVGIYSTAHKLVNLINQVVAALLLVIMPRMSFYFAEKKYDEINRLLRKILGFNLILGLPCAVGCYFMADDIILLIAGESYLEAVPVLHILLFGFVFSLIGGNFLGNAVLLPSKNEQYYMIVCCITAVVNLVGNYMVIPVYGTLGAAGMTSFCGLVILILLLFKIDKNVRIEKISRLIITPVVGCLGIAAICILCKAIEHFWFRVIISVAGSVIVYGAIQILFKNELVFELLDGVKSKFFRHRS